MGVFVGWYFFLVSTDFDTIPLDFPIRHCSVWVFGVSMLQLSCLRCCNVTFAMDIRLPQNLDWINYSPYTHTRQTQLIQWIVFIVRIDRYKLISIMLWLLKTMTVYVLCVCVAFEVCGQLGFEVSWWNWAKNAN